MIRSCGCDQEGKRLSWETGIKDLGFEVSPERCDREAVSYLEGERVPQNWGLVLDKHALKHALKILLKIFVSPMDIELNVNDFVWRFVQIVQVTMFRYQDKYRLIHEHIHVYWFSTLVGYCWQITACRSSQAQNIDLGSPEVQHLGSCTPAQVPKFPGT